MKNLRSILVKHLHEIADNIDKQSCELSDDEILDVMNAITHLSMSKEEACLYMRLSRSEFDKRVREGKIPKGRKRRGYKELRWYRDELDSLK